MEKFNMTKMFGAVTVGEKGQVVIPAQVRKSFKIKSGDKLLVFARTGGPIGFMPAQQFTQFLEHASGMLTKAKQGDRAK